MPVIRPAFLLPVKAVVPKRFATFLDFPIGAYFSINPHVSPLFRIRFRNPSGVSGTAEHDNPSDDGPPCFCLRGISSAAFGECRESDAAVILKSTSLHPRLIFREAELYSAHCCGETAELCSVARCRFRPSGRA